MKDYFTHVRGAGAHPPAFSAPPTAREPTTEEILQRGMSEGEWLVPVECVLRLSASAMVGLIRIRIARGEQPSRNARVICRGNRFFATVYFPGKADLFMALDCWSLDEVEQW